MAANISIDAEKAEIWVKDVEAEIEEVNCVLNRVYLRLLQAMMTPLCRGFIIMARIFRIPGSRCARALVVR